MKKTKRTNLSVDTASIDTTVFIKEGVKNRRVVGDAYLNLVSYFKKGRAAPVRKELDFVIKLNRKKLRPGDIYLHINPKFWDLIQLMKAQSQLADLNDRNNCRFKVNHKQSYNWWLRVKTLKENALKKQAKIKNKK